MERIKYRINYFDFDKLNELLNIFGLSLRIENGCCFFTDIETGIELSPYIYLECYGKEYTNDAETLLNSYSFYLKTRNKVYELGICARKDTFIVGSIYKREMVEPDFCEEIHLKSDNRECKLKEKTYNYDENACPRVTNFNEVNFSTSELIDPAQSVITIKNPDFSRYTELWFDKNKNTGEIYLMNTSELDTISQEDAISLIEQSRMFKDVMRLFSPKTLEGYTNSKGAVLTRNNEKPQ